MALDGRLRSSLATTELLAPNEHTGFLFWLVLRSTDKSLANPVLGPMSFEHKVTLTLPLKKQRHTVEWEAKDLPSVSLLLNKKSSKAHERRVLFAVPAQKEERQVSSKDLQKPG